MFDIDQMKPINDVLGHDTSDLSLKSIGGCLLKLFRGEDVACLFGGDKFMIILPEGSLADMWQRAEHLRDVVKKLQMEYDGKAIKPNTLSIGLTAFPDHGTTVGSLIKTSDPTSYVARSEGGDRIVIGRADVA